ncbi:MAG TPA: chromosomal replication initiator protein DnaA [Candidatus Fimihabitans intestinipullorum]|uniref:Chromosomal replication initiator protein DnaA n=1 Tax=Candidatus Fimihabitans intestinipullorum TaxID=2840820 RepID=A0A9D1HTU5_9BACT|nr:chromosomal replication initiator protein DnaA [Candidatus Fimihabitans intestinipullorum]
MDCKSIWKNFLNKVQENISPMLYETWFMETELVDLKDNHARVLVPMHVHKKHLKENYNDLIEEIFTELTGTNFHFDYYTKEELENDTTIDTNEVGVPSIVQYETNLNPNYTFENFIVGESNKFAKATSLAVAEKPGLMYNPLFIYGNSGLGKTHLMHAIGNYITKTSNKRVLYVTSEKFVSDFIGISRKNSEGNNFDNVEIFKKKYRDIDVLMIDDIQYLGSANQTQQEFFNTFNDLYGNNKQIIISSDRSPDDLKLLEDRLRTRFNWGLTIDILPPDFKLRMDIIDKKIEGNNMYNTLPKEVKEYIASNCTNDIRKLEGAITRVFAYATMMSGCEITLDLAIEALKDYFVKSIISKNKIDQVMQLVANTYNIGVEDLKSKKRSANISVPRQIAMYICRTVLEESFPKIGIEFGGKDHTTVMHSVDKIKKEIESNPILEMEIQKIIQQIK